MAKTIRATFRQGRIEPLEAVDLPEGTELLVTFEEAAAIDRRIARAVKAVRASKRG